MGMSQCPTSPKYGYHFDTQEHDVRRSRKRRPCRGGSSGRGSAGMGLYRSADCTGWIEPGDIYCATVMDLFVSESMACIPCATLAHAVEAVQA